jgi:hypothetical protein
MASLRWPLDSASVYLGSGPAAGWPETGGNFCSPDALTAGSSFWRARRACEMAAWPVLPITTQRENAQEWLSLLTRGSTSLAGRVQSELTQSWNQLQATRNVKTNEDVVKGRQRQLANGSRSPGPWVHSGNSRGASCAPIVTLGDGPPSLLPLRPSRFPNKRIFPPIGARRTWL